MKPVDAAGILDIAMSGTSLTLLARVGDYRGAFENVASGK
jgi:hypothetical protein